MLVGHGGNALGQLPHVLLVEVAEVLVDVLYPSRTARRHMILLCRGLQLAGRLLVHF